jgi:ent-kaurene oxidase
LFTIDIFNNASQLRGYHSFIRPIAAFLLGSSKSVQGHRDTAKKILAPIIEKRLAEIENDSAAAKKYNDTLQWLMNLVNPEDKNTDALAELQLELSMAAIHTTTLSLVTTLTDLAKHPEYIEPIREEMMAVITEDGGMLQKTTLRKMKKTDSFIKEAMRAKLGLCMLFFLLSDLKFY